MTHIDYLRPTAERRVVLTYKNFPVSHNVSHIGLGVTALNTAKVLRENGIYSDVWPILNAKDLAARIAASNPQPTHVVIGAPWLPTLDLQAFLVFRFPAIHFAVVCHSNIGFLQADPQAITNFRQDLDLEQGSLNFFAGGNSRRFCNWITAAYTRPCLYLPNLYYLESEGAVHRRPWSGGPLRIGSFGAVRPLKNTLNAAAAVLEIANDFNTPIDFHISVGRIEGGSIVVRALSAMLDGSPLVKLVKDEWWQWPTFRKWVRSMNLLMQPSFSESFNMVTADGAAECVPSVVSEAIDWAPDHWKAEMDDAVKIARVGKNLLGNPHAGIEGFHALERFNRDGIREWKSWLGV
jgi:hypothetical protein